MRHGLLIGLLLLVVVPPSPASAARPRGSISTAGAALSVPAGWHAAVAGTPRCDPERLIVVSSAPLRLAGGTLAPPRAGEVLILLLEDRYRVDRPLGGLRRPAHFTITWNHLTRLKGGGDCGDPVVPAFMRWFRERGRYLGFIVYPGGAIGARTSAQALALMDSLSVRA